MRLYVDLDNPVQLIQGPGNRQPVTELRFKRGTSPRLQVQFLRDGVPELLADATVIRFGPKALGKYDGGFAAFTNEFTTPEDESGFYEAFPSFNTDEINTLLMSPDGNENNDVAEVTLMAEFSWRRGAALPEKTETFSVVIANAVDNGDETAASEAGPSLDTRISALEVTAEELEAKAFLSVTDFGAVGDGVTDDTAAIAAAIAALNTSGGTLLFPPAAYLDSGSHVLRGPLIAGHAGHMRIIGKGARWLASGSGALLRYGGGAGITSLVAGGGNTVVTTTTPHGFSAGEQVVFYVASTEATTGATVSSVGAATEFTVPGTITGATGVKTQILQMNIAVEDIAIEKSGAAGSSLGVDMYANAANHVFRNVVILGFHTGIRSEDQNNVVLENLRVNNNTYGVRAGYGAHVWHIRGGNYGGNDTGFETGYYDARFRETCTGAKAMVFDGCEIGGNRVGLILGGRGGHYTLQSVYWEQNSEVPLMIGHSTAEFSGQQIESFGLRVFASGGYLAHTPNTSPIQVWCKTDGVILDLPHYERHASLPATVEYKNATADTSELAMLHVTNPCLKLSGGTVINSDSYSSIGYLRMFGDDSRFDIRRATTGSGYAFLSYGEGAGTFPLYRLGLFGDNDLTFVEINASGTKSLYWDRTNSRLVSAGGMRAATLSLTTLPTSDPAVAGQVWNDSGTLKISAG